MRASTWAVDAPAIEEISMKTKRNRVIGMIAIFVAILTPSSSIAADPSVNEQLLQAVVNGSPERVKSLLEQGADVNAKDEYGHTVLMNATGPKSGNFDDTDVKDDGRGKPANPEVVKLLLDRGADVNAMTETGFTILMYAAETGKSRNRKTSYRQER
jgi:uncharacterized protein